MRTVSTPPLLFTLAKAMVRRRIRGGYRLLQMGVRFGMLNVVVRYRLERDVSFCVPLFRPDHWWDQRDVEAYEANLVDSFCDALEPLNKVILFDCGADIGIFSALICSRTSCVARIVAFEPNADVVEFLRNNLSQLPIPGEAIPKAVSCVEGSGQLESPGYDASNHARFLIPGRGSLEVVTVDSIGVRGENVALKLDVEGGELDVLRGAARTISSASECVVAIEANPRVTIRTNCDPIECLKFLQALRPFDFVIAETGERLSTSSRLIGGSQTETLNIVGWTKRVVRAFHC
jgi:FkbM family methyltransferase